MWQRDAVSEFSQVLTNTWLCSRAMRFQSRPTNWPSLTIESPVAQWLEHPTRSRRVVGSSPIWGSDFSIKKKNCFIFICSQGSCPAYMYDLLKFNADLPTRTGRYNKLNLTCPRFNRETEGGRSFSVFATRLRNQLPIDLKKRRQQLLFPERPFIDIF